MDQKLDVSSSAKAIPLIFTENSGQGHVAVVKRLESKSVEIIDGLGNCQFFLNIRRVAAPFYLQVETTRESSTVTGETSVHNDDVGAKAGVGGGAEVEVNEAFGSAF